VRLLEWLRSRHAVKWAVAGGLVVLVIGLIWGGWALWKTRYEAQGSIALTQARALAAQSQAPGASPETRQRAEKALQDVIAEYPRLSSVGQAAYLLGSLRFANAQYASARAAFEIARDKAGSPTLAALAALDVGYSWEADKNYPEAEKAYQSAISSAGPKSFLYEEAMLDIARVQDLGGKREAAVETYQRLLKDLPDSRRAEEFRSRMASLQTTPKPR
jgi:tetratricopeptide (TPR) repeat protein